VAYDYKAVCIPCIKAVLGFGRQNREDPKWILLSSVWAVTWSKRFVYLQPAM